MLIKEFKYLIASFSIAADGTQLYAWSLQFVGQFWCFIIYDQIIELVMNEEWINEDFSLSIYRRCSQ